MIDSFRELAGLIRRECGVLITEGQFPSLAAAVRRVGYEPHTFLAAASDPVSGARAVDRLIEEITVQETSFLRERAQLEAIGWHVLLERAEALGRSHVRVWSVGCATGEEAYTLGMLACEAFAPGQPHVSILGTDVSSSALARAVDGRYKERSVRELPEPLRERYLERDGERFVVRERLRGFVRFARHNLVQDPIPPLGETAFDLIVCRNVLIYFDRETIDRTLASLEQALEPHGTLLLGSADALSTVSRRLAVVGAGATRAPRPTPPRRALRRPLGRAREAHTVESPDPDSSFLQGLVELEAGDPASAVASFRRALYLSPAFGLAAFKLARAQEQLGDAAAARRAYEQALRIFAKSTEHAHHLEQIDLTDVVAVCRARAAALR